MAFKFSESANPPSVVLGAAAGTVKHTKNVANKRSWPSHTAVFKLIISFNEHFGPKNQRFVTDFTEMNDTHT